MYLVSPAILKSKFWERKGKERFYLTTHSTHFIYGYMASGISKGPFT